MDRTLRQRSQVTGALLSVVLMLVFVGCVEDRPLTASERGRRIYLGACTTCHNPDPAIAGGTGPAIAGSSRELIEARVLRAGYPLGYTPQRPTKGMVPLPHLAPYIDDLAAFLSPLPAATEAGSSATLP